MGSLWCPGGVRGPRGGSSPAYEGGGCIDRIFTNFHDHLGPVRVLPPLGTDGDDGGRRVSDHLIVAVDSCLPRTEAYELLSYSYRYYTDESSDSFMSWIVGHDWESVLTAVGSNAKARAYQETIDSAVGNCFKLITTTRKSTDPPWINAAVKKRVRQRRSVYAREGSCLLYTTPSPRDS